LGACLAWALFGGIVVVSDAYIYTLVVKPWLIALGIVWAVLTGVVGGLFPAIRAARLPVATVLRGI
jgi:putative ABC transport system permease protein